MYGQVLYFLYFPESVVCDSVCIGKIDSRIICGIRAALSDVPLNICVGHSYNYRALAELELVLDQA